MSAPAHSALPSPPPHTDVASLRAATDKLLGTAARLDDAALAEPSLLPGWTRGHVLAHVARNADALGNVLAGLPMYASADARDADIERDAPRTRAVHLDDLRATAARLDETFTSWPESEWERTVELRNGVTDLACSIPFRRLTEVELHHVDLGTGYGVEDLPGAFVERQLAHMARRFHGHPDLPVALELRTDDGTGVRTGAAEGDPLVVAGSATALVGWLTGRSAGTGLSAGAPLPALPAL